MQRHFWVLVCSRRCAAYGDVATTRCNALDHPWIAKCDNGSCCMLHVSCAAAYVGDNTGVEALLVELDVNAHVPPKQRRLDGPLRLHVSERIVRMTLESPLQRCSVAASQCCAALQRCSVATSQRRNARRPRLRGSTRASRRRIAGVRGTRPRAAAQARPQAPRPAPATSAAVRFGLEPVRR